VIVDKIWKLTNTVKVGLAPRSSHSQKQATFPDKVCFYSPPGKRTENTNTGEGGKKVRTTSDDAGGKSVSEKSKSTKENVRVRTPQVGNLVRHGQVATPFFCVSHTFLCVSHTNTLAVPLRLQNLVDKHPGLTMSN